ncbi:TPM domain-containing protein [Hymenobacter sp. ASUV-10]|uniref:TPM domain-containing protein n=1 Tax=Hymenobacter aranciens TaxID=3063996 RepID=A0ABT9B939_9BACT|nr:TPM domain-containing protein [Hymenobacter sp. ASUV-10]MDO7874789.1 TPM domain-containing protein [Hymenobacter sp. ASUV-10]
MLALFITVLLGGCQQAEPPARITADNYLTTIPDPKTLGESYVSDPDSLLDFGTVAALNARLDSLDHSGRAHIDVVLVRSIGEAVPKTAAYELFNKWKIGDKATNNGLLMLLVEDQHRIEFETGYGLEGDLPDAICYRIQQQHMIAPAREGRYDVAVQQGVDALIRRLRPAVVRSSGPGHASHFDSVKARIDSLVAAQQEQMDHMLDVVPVQIEDPAVSLVGQGGDDAGEESAVGFWVLIVGLLGLYLALAHLTTRGSGSWWPHSLGVVAVMVALLVRLNYPGISTWQLLGVGYLLALLYLHGYFGWLYRRSRQADWQALSPHEQYRRLAQSHHHLGFTAVLFPLALAFYWPWHRQRLQALRDTPPLCPTCLQPMLRLTAEQEKSYLAPGQQTEETIESIDYDLWQCPSCATHEQLAYPNLHSSATTCPSCKHRTLMFVENKTVQAATTSSGGWGWRISRCRFCQHEVKARYEIARQSSSSSSSSGGSSSSGSSSSGSSSGGSSGGGGAGSSW